MDLLKPYQTQQEHNYNLEGPNFKMPVILRTSPQTVHRKLCSKI
jgi:hypothetical protein